MSGGDTRDAVYDFICEYHTTRGYGPSMEDIARKLELSNRSTAHYHVRRLADLGLVVCEQEISRSVRPTNWRERIARSLP